MAEKIIKLGKYSKKLTKREKILIVIFIFLIIQGSLYIFAIEPKAMEENEILNDLKILKLENKKLSTIISDKESFSNSDVIELRNEELIFENEENVNKEILPLINEKGGKVLSINEEDLNNQSYYLAIKTTHSGNYESSINYLESLNKVNKLVLLKDFKLEKVSPEETQLDLEILIPTKKGEVDNNKVSEKQVNDNRNSLVNSFFTNKNERIINGKSIKKKDNNIKNKISKPKDSSKINIFKSNPKFIENSETKDINQDIGVRIFDDINFDKGISIYDDTQRFTFYNIIDFIPENSIYGKNLNYNELESILDYKVEGEISYIEFENLIVSSVNKKVYISYLLDDTLNGEFFLVCRANDDEIILNNERDLNYYKWDSLEFKIPSGEYDFEIVGLAFENNFEVVKNSRILMKNILIDSGEF